MRMNKLLKIGVMFTLLFMNGKALANEKDSLVLNPFGLGFDTQISSSASESLGSSIFCVFNINNKFRIEPEISYQKTKIETSSSKNEANTYAIGAGLFRMYQYQKTNIYIGARVACGRMITENTYTTTTYNPSTITNTSYYYYTYEPTEVENKTSTEVNLLGVSPTIGAEYFFNPCFSIGGEVGLALVKATDNNDNENKVGTTSTYSSVMIRFYLK